MSTQGLRRARLGLLLLAGCWLLGSPLQAQTEKKAVTLLVKLPADAELFVDGKKTTSTGPERLFESDEPVEVGKKFFYRLKAVWKKDGKDVVVEKKVPVMAGESNEVDLNPQSLHPKAVLTVTGPAAVDVDAGGKKSIAIKITREGYKGPVKVMVAGAPAGVKIPDVTIAPDKTDASLEVSADKAAKAGSSTLAVKVGGGDTIAETKVKLEVKPAKETPKDKDKPKDKDTVKDKPKDKDTVKDKETPKDKPKDKDAGKDKETPKDAAKDKPKDKDTVKDKETPKDKPKDKDTVKDKETPKDAAKDKDKEKDK